MIEAAVKTIKNNKVSTILFILILLYIVNNGNILHILSTISIIIMFYIGVYHMNEHHKLKILNEHLHNVIKQNNEYKAGYTQGIVDGLKMFDEILSDPNRMDEIIIDTVKKSKEHIKNDK